MSEILNYNESDFNEVCPTWLDVQKNSQFDDLLRNAWDQAMANGIFRYTMDHVETRILEGPKQYVAQLNTKRATERRAPHNITSLNQPFNGDLFNFTRIKDKEILFMLNHTDKSCQKNHVQNSIEPSQVERHLVIVNISPLEYGHVLIVPQVDSCLPQVLTEKAFQIGIESVLLSNRRSFRLGFNSLCAYASVNHLHFHAYYLEHELLLEHAPVIHLTDILYQSNAMPVPAFVFQVHGTPIHKLTRVLHKITRYFQENEIAHSMLMVKGAVFGEDKLSKNTTVRIYIWPRQKFKGTKSSTELQVAVIELEGHLPCKGMAPDAFNVAMAEMSGQLPIKDEESYNTITEKVVDEILETAKLPDTEFHKIKSDVVKMVEEDGPDDL